MPTTYSTDLRLALLGNGEDAGTWGNYTNTNLGTLLEQAICGLTSVDVSSGAVTLTTVNGATDQARSAVLVATGTPSSTAIITIPNVNKTYLVNNTTAQPLSIKTSSGSAFTIPSYSITLIYCDGSNNVVGSTSAAFTSLTVNGNSYLGGASGAQSLYVPTVSSSVNYIQASGNTTGNAPSISAQGSDTNIPIVIQSKGTGGVYLTANNYSAFQNSSGALQFNVTSTASAVNYLQTAAATTGNAPTISAQGSDTNININLVPKGSGQLLVNGSSISSVPTGAVFHFAASTAPSGYLECNGAAISRSTYSALFSVVGTIYGAGDGSTTFNLPDLRGEFIRGYDDGRGVDSGRAFGSTQSDAYRSHSHGVNDPGHAHIYGSFGAPAGSGVQGGNDYTFNANSTNVANTGISIQNNGGSETRPVNVALLPCIKT